MNFVKFNTTFYNPLLSLPLLLFYFIFVPFSWVYHYELVIYLANHMTNSTFKNQMLLAGVNSPYPLLGYPCFLHSPQCVHEPAPVAWMLWWRFADVEQCRTVGSGCQTQHFHQTADCLVTNSAPFPGCQGLHCPVGVTLE